MVADLLTYNSTTNLDEYNCGSFALGTFDWYEPESFDIAQDFDEMLRDCVNDILNDFPELSIINDPKEVPLEQDVIGFRVSFDPNYEREYEWEKETYYVGDFHFILRREGVWLHKQGGTLISQFQGDPYDIWEREEGSLDYNSEITWFTR